MAKVKQTFICEACGHETFKWMGKCPRCNAWDTIKELKIDTSAGKSQDRKHPVALVDEDIEEARTILGMDEMDRVLGGGLTTGSSILLGGDPGIGKTTLCFEIASKLVELGLEVLYVSGEESLRQLAGRKKRLGLKGPFSILVTNQLNDILAAAQEKAYGLVVIDSIQSIYNEKLPFLPGSMSQIRDVSSRLIRELKSRETTHIFVGHVTKEGAIAGPKILEHMVDTVLYFEGDKTLPYRMLRAIKNRYGPVDEIGLFQMTREGLVSAEPSLFFMSERVEGSSGTTLFPYITGSRPLIVEVQSVAPKTFFPIPKKLSVGYDVNRLFILAAVMEKSLGLTLSDRDIYVNVTGGIKVAEPAVDLAVAAAILSGVKNIGWQETAFVGEVGLTGEVRRVISMELRLRECERLKIKRVFCPRGLGGSSGMEVICVRSVRELAQYLT
ncbi:MAG: repair protein RadA [Deltaproteobacteria bacterium]|nr:repair protein RadA [Deltaproteobacteria bacterium]